VAESGGSRIVELDAKGVVTTTIPIDLRLDGMRPPHYQMRGLALTRDDTYLVVTRTENAVIEFDRQGKRLWQFTLAQIKANGLPGKLFGVDLLPTGNVLIAAEDGYFELDRTKNAIVWKWSTAEMPEQVRGPALAGTMIAGQYILGGKGLFGCTPDRHIPWQVRQRGARPSWDRPSICMP